MNPRVIPGTIEQRVFALTELRVAPESEWPIEGYASLFNVRSLDLGGFQEIILPGAFARTLAKPSTDVRALFNHDPNFVLGRSTAGTLQLVEDGQGLRIGIKPPDTQYARDLVISMQRGDVDQMSFSFTVGKDLWTPGDPLMLRSVQDVEDLFDVSIVTYPAYPATRVLARSAELDAALTAAGLDLPLLESITRARQGQAAPEDVARIETTLTQLRGFVPAERIQADAPAADEDGLKARTEWLRQSLEIARRR